MVLDNPFRLLGIPATADSREVRRCIDELAVRASLGAAPNGLDSDALGSVRHSLEDPVQRLEHEVFWLHSSPDQVDPAIEIGAGDGDLSVAVAHLRVRAGRHSGADRTVALHDLAVLVYARYEFAPDESDPTEAVGLWADVYRGDEFWDYLATRAADTHDPRVTRDVVERARAYVPARVLEALTRRVSELLEEHRFEPAAAVLRSIRSSGFPSEAVAESIRRALGPLRTRIRDGAKTVNELVDAIPSSEGVTPATHRKFANAEKALVERVLAPFARLRSIDPVFSDQELADAGAAAARRLSVAVCNIAEDWVWGYVLLRQALEMAQTPESLSTLASDQAQVRASLHHAEAARAAHRGEELVAAAHYGLAIPYARSDEERLEWLNLASGARIAGALSDSRVELQKQTIATGLEQREAGLKACVADAMNRPAGSEIPEAEEEEQVLTAVSPARMGQPLRKHHWGRWVAATVAVAIIAAIAIASRHHAPSASSSGTPTVAGSGNGAAAVTRSKVEMSAVGAALVTPKSVASYPTALCLTERSLDTTISKLDIEIAGKRRVLQTFHDQEAPIFAAIKQIKRDYPSHTLPADVYTRWSSLRQQYNTLVGHANAVVRDGNALVRLQHAKVKVYNRLVKEC